MKRKFIIKFNCIELSMCMNSVTEKGVVSLYYYMKCLYVVQLMHNFYNDIMFKVESRKQKILSSKFKSNLMRIRINLNNRLH